MRTTIMTKAFAINTVTVCVKPGERGPDGKTISAAVLEDKLPGTIFECDDEDYEAFEALGAVRKPTRAELSEWKASDAAKKPAEIKPTELKLGSGTPSTGGQGAGGSASTEA
jgi:hypothetical protein